MSRSQAQVLLAFLHEPSFLPRTEFGAEPTITDHGKSGTGEASEASCLIDRHAENRLKAEGAAPPAGGCAATRSGRVARLDDLLNRTGVGRFNPKGVVVLRQG